MEFTKIWIARWGNLVMKCVLSFVVIWLLVSLLNLMRLWYAIHPAPKRVGDEPPVSSSANHKPEDFAQNNEIYWPQFFGSDGVPIQEMSINGVRVFNQGWETTVPAADVIAYYREQMTARGWQDVTEEALNLQPELKTSGSGKNGLQNQSYLMLYSRLINSDLVLRRGNWSMQVNTSPSDRKVAQTRVSICAASTPSLENFIAQLESSFGEDEARGGQPLDIVQQNGKNRYQTTIAARSESSAQAFQAVLADFETKGWRPAMFLPQQQTRPRFFAWLTRGKQYAALSVTASPQGNGSSVTFTEVTPE